MPDFTEPQKQAVAHDDGPCRVFAGAGSGKTTVLTERYARLIKSGVAPENILCCTFTRAAADELKKRTEKNLGYKPSGWWIGTIHSQFYKIVNAELADVASGNYRLPVLERWDCERMIRSIIKSEGLRALALLHESEVVKMIDEWRLAMIRPSEIEDKVREWHEEDHAQMLEAPLCPVTLPCNEAAIRVFIHRQGALAYQLFDRMKSEKPCIDLTDQIYKAWDILDRNPVRREYWRRRFRHILVDEFQDIDPCQWAAVKHLAGPNGNLYVVGDDDQAIYAFRGAEPSIMIDFDKDYPSSKTILLDRNFRCPRNIVSMANRGIGNNINRHPKVFFSVNAAVEPDLIEVSPENEAVAVADYVQSLNESGAKWSEMVLIYRMNAQSLLFEMEFMDRDIPFETKSGKCFYDNPQVKDVLAYMELGMAKNVMGNVERVANKCDPPRMIRRDVLTRWMDRKPTIDGLMEVQAEPFQMGALRRLHDDLVSIMNAARSGATAGALMEHVLNLTGYERYARGDESPNGDDDLALTMKALRFDLRRHSTPEAFLGHVARTREMAGKKKKRRNAVTFSTFHGVKGLEWPHVILAGMNEGVIPHSRSLMAGPAAVEEERRLAHVGLTRTKKTALVVVTERPSRFVNEWFLTGEGSSAPYSPYSERTSPNGDGRSSASHPSS